MFSIFNIIVLTDYKSLFIQFIGIAGTIAYLLSYQFKSNKTLFKCQIVSCLFYSLHFLLLEAYTGCLSALGTLLRACFLVSNKEMLHTKKACAFVCLVQILIGMITFDGYISVLPIIANISLTIAGFNDDARQIRLAGIFINSPLWIVYDVFVGSWAGVIDEITTEISILISVFRHKFNKKENNPIV